jgi:hypothetical protein
MLTYHDPQMKYWRNMKTERRTLRAVCTGGPRGGKVGRIIAERQGEEKN